MVPATRTLVLIGLASFSSLAGCTSDHDVGVDVLDTGLESAPTEPILEGSLAAQAIRAFVNHADTSVRLLDETVGLSTRVSEAIVNHREEIGPFDSIAELSAIEHVGPLTLQKLLEYAVQNGFAPPQLYTIPDDLLAQLLRYDGECTGSKTETFKYNRTGEDTSTTTPLGSDVEAQTTVTIGIAGDYTFEGLLGRDDVQPNAHRVQSAPDGTAVFEEIQDTRDQAEDTWWPDKVGIRRRTVEIHADGTSLFVSTTFSVDEQAHYGCCGGRYHDGTDSCNPEYCAWADLFVEYTCSAAVDWADL